MGTYNLPNKPLIEAIFELKWEFASTQQQNYKILPGRLFDKLSTEYPFFEPLPASNFPDEVTNGIVQYRFRKKENGWPLIQLGNGIFTVNDTENYGWEDFSQRVKDAISNLFSVLVNKESFKITDIILRYIDAEEFDYVSSDILTFLRKNMKVGFELPSELFTKVKVSQKIVNYDFRVAYEVDSPESIVELRFAKGKKNYKDAIIWETIVKSHKIQSQTISHISEWLDGAHDITHNWFDTIIDGSLKDKYMEEIK